jgi:Cu(I)/Ag(I) efflux system periplasmic protein CusF
MNVRKLILASAFALAVASPTAAQGDMVDGQVTKVDASAGKITIKHGPLKKFEMDAMTMVFRAADPAMLKAVKAGDRVKFEADKINGQFTVTRIEKAKAKK